MDTETDKEEQGDRLDGALSRLWGFLGRLDLGETLGKEERRILRRMSRRWRHILKLARNQEAVRLFDKRLRRHGL